MSLPPARWVIAGLLAGLGAGCATQRAMNRQQVELTQVELRLVQLGEQLAAVDSLLQAGQAEVRQQRAEQAAEGEQLGQQMQQLQARVDESARRLGEVRQELERLRVYGVGKGGRPAPPAQEAGSGEGASAAGPALVADPQSLYDMALADMKAGNFDLAAGELAQFVESFPDADLADNALYWQGECHYARKDFTRAAASFEEVLARYPQGDKVPAALLKLGFSRLALKETTRGTKHLKDLVSRFPDAAEATQARARLKTLSGNARPAGRK
ncbi:MAG: tol-pal system protein YbgF [Gemmatimonadota bacterium]